MKKIVILIALAAIAMLMASCTVEKRTVTAKHGVKNSIFYFAYYEWEETYIGMPNYGGITWVHDDWSKVKRCNLRDDNTMACVEEQEAIAVLNPQHTGEVNQSSSEKPGEQAAPAEAAPAEQPAEAAPAEQPAEAAPAETPAE